jgi:3-hydroxyisobutyrate dehydrogenase-like beta-hydroxyacid dehydrogenase
MAALAHARGIGWVDAPVSGGPRAAGTGELTVLAGGESAALQAASAAAARGGRERHAPGAVQAADRWPSCATS